MRDTRFITPPLSIVLDLVRALAALAVLIGHAKQLGHYSGPYPFSLAFQHNAVVVFFVLSGLVIAASVDRAKASGRPQTLSSYALTRAARILPVALPALAISLVVMLIDAAIATTPIFGEDAQGVPASEWLFALTFLSESYQTAFAPNPPYWSLCYEVWFYALFAVATFMEGWKRMAWLAALALVAGPNVLLLLPVWLVGVALARLPIARRVPFWLGLAFVALALTSLFVVPQLARPVYRAIHHFVPWRLGFSLFAITDLAMALAMALGFAGLRTLTLNCGVWLERMATPIRYGANMSFSLYLLHWPLLKVLRVLGLSNGSGAGFVSCWR